MTTTCNLRFHHCRLAEGQTGACRVRVNRDGKIIPLNYGRLTALALDPIEKKPLRRFHPGSWVLSAGSFGCNLHCPFCQNAEITAAGAETYTRDCTPEQLTQQALRLREQGNIGIAYTYNEPLVGYEFVRDCAALVRQAGMVNVLVTNGTLEEEPWRQLLPLIDAVNIDLKGFTEDWYKRLGGDLETVKRSIRLAGFGQPGNPAACLPLFPAVPNAGPLAHAGGYRLPPGTGGPGTAALCLHRQLLK